MKQDQIPNSENFLYIFFEIWQNLSRLFWIVLYSMIRLLWYVLRALIGSYNYYNPNQKLLRYVVSCFVIIGIVVSLSDILTLMTIGQEEDRFGNNQEITSSQDRSSVNGDSSQTGSGDGSDEFELVEERTEFSKSFIVDDKDSPTGKATKVRSYTQRIHYQTDDGWKEIDSRIITISDHELAIGTNSQDRFGYRNRANDFEILFGEVSSSGLKFTGYGFEFEITGNYVVGSVPMRSMPAKISNNVITYEDVLDDVDLRYTVNPDGFGKEIVIKGDRGLGYDWTRVTIPIKVNRNIEAVSGVDRVTSSNLPNAGGLKIPGIDSLIISPVVSYDALGKVSGGDQMTPNASDTSLIITPNVSFLQDPARQYPIIIDPGTQRQNVTQDTFVSPSTGYTPQGGLDPRKSLFIGNYYDSTIGVWYNRSRTLLQFAGVNRGVRNAYVVLQHYGTTGGRGFTANVTGFTQPINERTVHHFNQPALSGDFGDVVFSNYNSNRTPLYTQSTDLSSLINSQLGSGSIRIGLVSQNENATGGVVVCSKDAIDVAGHQCWNKAVAPYLEYTQNYAPAPPTAVGIYVDGDDPVSLQALNADIVGNCDESVIPATGRCRTETKLRFRIDNVQDGDHDALDTNQTGFAQIQASHDNVNFFDMGPRYGGWQGFCCTQVPDVNVGDFSGYWGAYLIDTDGQTSLRSNTLNFTHDTTPPTIPQLPVLPEFSKGLQQEFVFSASTDAISQSKDISYFIQVARDNEFRDIVLEQWQDANPSIRVGGLEDGKKYYYRVKARDRTIASSPSKGNISAWSNVVSSTQDGVKPKIKTITSDYQRFSPSNLTSEGEYDFVTITGEVYDLHLDSVVVDVLGENEEVVARISKTMTTGLVPTDVMPQPSTVTAITDDTNTQDTVSDDSDQIKEVFEQFRVSWDGMLADGSTAPDGAYRLKVYAQDKAGNTSEDEDEARVVIKDDSGASIAISSPQLNYWTNQSEAVIKGQVGVYNQPDKEDKDVQKLEVMVGADSQTKVTSQPTSSTDIPSMPHSLWKDISDRLTADNLFEYQSSLSLGSNQFMFRTTDTVANKIDSVGNPQDSGSASPTKIWTIHYENHIPKLDPVSPLGKVNHSDSLVFRVRDIDLVGDNSQTSGFEGENLKKSLSVTLIYDQNTHSMDQSQTNSSDISNRLDLIKNGEPLLSGLSAPSCVIDSTKVINSSNRSSEAVCTVDLPMLEESTMYKVLVEFEDSAGNRFVTQDSTNEWEFISDTINYSDIISPVQNMIIARKEVIVSGFGEEGSSVTIRHTSNPNLDTLGQQPRLISFNLLESDSQLKVIQNGVDITDSFNYNLQVLCARTIPLDDSYQKDSLLGCTFEVSLPLITNSEQNKESVTNVFDILNTDGAGNTKSVSRSITSDLFSFTLSAQANLNYFSPNGDGFQDGVKFGLVALDPSKTIDPNNPQENTANEIIDSYSVEIRDESGNVVAVSQGEDVPNEWFFDGKTNSGQWLSDGVYSYSLTVKTTTGIEVSTQPKTITARTIVNDQIIITVPTDNYVTTRGMINVMGQAPVNSNLEVCIMEGDRCIRQFPVRSDSQGLFSRIVSLPRPSSRTVYILQVRLIGVSAVATSLLSNKVNVVYNVDDEIFASTKVTPTFRGINSEAEIRDLIRGKLTVNDLKTIQITSNVRHDVRAVNIEYADYTNLKYLPDTDLQSGLSEIYNSGSMIASISGKTELDRRLNPELNSWIKDDLSPQDASLVSQDSCQEVDSVLSNDTTADTGSYCTWIYNYPIPFWLNGGQYEIGLTGYKGETSKLITHGIVIDGRTASSPVVLSVRKITTAGQQAELTTNRINQTSSTNVDSVKRYTNKRAVILYGASDPNAVITLVSKEGVTVTTKANNNGIFQAQFTLPDKDGEYIFHITSQLNTDVSATSLTPLIIVLDRVQPQLMSVLTSVPNRAINPWTTSGSEVSYHYSSNEGLARSAVVSEDRFVANGDQITTPMTSSVVSSSGDSLNSFVAKLTINRQSEAVYYSAIALQDYAGNQIVYSNARLTPAQFTLLRTAIMVQQRDPNLIDLQYRYIDPQNPSIQSALPTSYPYSSTPRPHSFDFRLFIDNTRPDPTTINTEGWGRMDGIFADGKLPEIDRLLSQARSNNNPDSQDTLDQNSPQLNNSDGTPVYAIRGDTITIQGVGEASARVRIYNLAKDQLIDFNDSLIPTAQPLITNTASPLSSVSDVRSNTGQDGTQAPCSSTGQPKRTPPTPLQMYIRESMSITTKQSDNCQYQARYTFNGSGVSPEGIPQDWYTFQTKIVDLAGNESEPSNTVIVYHDNDNPDNGKVSSLSSESYSPVVDWNNDTGLTPITKDTSITSRYVGERQSDIQYSITNPKGDLQSPQDPSSTVDQSPYSIHTTNGADGTSDQIISLGNTVKDEDRTDTQCTTMSGLRRIGICDDGVYRINSRESDSSGNLSPWQSTTLERDTVSPLKPQVRAGKTGNILGEYLNVDIKGEYYTTANITVIDSNGTKHFLMQELNSEGNYTSINLLNKKLECGRKNYQLSVILTDRAGNHSVASDIITITTQDCPVCNSSGSGIFASPVKPGLNVSYSSFYPTRQIPGNFDAPHAGIDFAAPSGTPVYAAYNGTVKRVNHNYPNISNISAGWANVVILQHIIDGIVHQTIYAHLDQTQVVINNQTVSKGQLIGYVGTSGNSTGPHLHFQVEKQGAELDPALARSGEILWNMAYPVDPRDYLDNISSNLSQEQQLSNCATLSYGNGESLEEYDTVTKEEAVTIIAEYIRDRLGDQTQLEYNHKGYREYELIGNFGDNKKNIEHLKSRIDVYEAGCKNHWIHNLGLIQESNGSLGSDGAIIVNPYEKKAYIVKDWIWHTYSHNNMGCGVIGVPQSNQQNAIVQGNSIATSDRAFVQRFRRAKENTKNNSIYSYKTKQDNQRKTYFVINRVADGYESKGGTTSQYGFPTGDTYGDGDKKYCKQWFENGEIKKCKVQFGISETRIVSGGEDVKKCKKTCTYTLHLYHGAKNYSGQDVWVISHGWNDDTDGWVNKIAEITKEVYPNSTIFLLDWRNASAGRGKLGFVPESQATWIAPIAKDASEVLKEWGMVNGENLNVIGHSLGSLMVTELSTQMDKAKMSILLSPPGDGGDGEYIVDSNSKRKITTLNNTAYFTRSFFADDGGDDKSLSITADESIYIDTWDAHYAGESHISTPHIFLETIGRHKFDGGFLSLDNTEHNGFERFEYFNNRPTHGLIQASGEVSSARNESLEFAKDGITKVNGTAHNDRIKVQRKNDVIAMGGGGNDEFWNHEDYNTNPITIADFSFGDKINLFKRQRLKYDLDDYHIVTHRDKVEIKRKDRVSMIVLGERAKEVKPEDLATMKRTGKEAGVFIPRQIN